MQYPLIPHRIIFILLSAAIFLPITICVIFGAATLLEKMGDSLGGVVLSRIALGAGILWAIDLIGLVVLQAISTLKNPDDKNEE